MTSRFRSFLAATLAIALGFAVTEARVAVSAAVPVPQLRIVGPAGEDPPVVNERRNIRLRVVDETGDVSVTVWKTGSPTVAKVTKKGVLKGRLYGFATITAVTGRGEVTTTAVVARVTRRHGSMGDGDTKSDSAGRIYLTSPDEQVIYRSDGVRDEIFAGTKGEAGYQDGTGQNARFHYPTGLGVDVSTNGGLYAADTDNHCIRKVGFDGRTSIATGVPQFPGRIDADVVPAAEAVFDSPKGVAAFGQSLFVADTRNHALYYLNGRGDAVSLLAGQPGVLGFRNGLFREASFKLPSGIAINTEGNLLAVADTGNNAVRLVRIEPGGSPYLGRVSTAGVASKAGRGAPGTGIVFSAPTSVAFDSAQNVCVVDSLGASVITRAADGTEAQVLLAQPGSLGRPASIVVSGTRAIIADADASSPGVAIAVVEVGAPKITSVSRTRIREGTETDETLITGENFPPEARVVVDGTPLASVRVDGSTRLIVRLPVLTRGSRLISVITRGGVAQTEIDVVPPTLDELSEGEITTYAGTATPALGDGGLASDSTLDFGVAARGEGFSFGDIRIDGAGNLFFASPNSNRVRRVDAASGVISTVVGTGLPVVVADGNLGTAFGLYQPRSVAVAPDGALYVADTGFDRIVRVDPVSSEATTVLGKAGQPGSGKAGGLAGTGFLLRQPTDIAIDRFGSIFVSDSGNRRVLRVDAGTGVVSVVAGGGPVNGLPVDGELATARYYRVDSLDIDESGLLALEVDIPDENFGRIVCVGDDKRIRVCADGGSNVALDGNGGLLFSDVSNNAIVRLNLESGARLTVGGGGVYGALGEGGPATQCYVEGVSLDVDGSGNVLVADKFSERIRRIDREKGTISTIAGGRRVALAGDGGCATSANISGMTDIAWVDGVGLCIADATARGIRVVDPQSGNLSTPIGNGPFQVNGSSSDGAPALGASVIPYCVAAGSRSRLLFNDTPSDKSPTIVWMVGESETLNYVAGHGTDGSDGALARNADFGSVADMLQAPNGDIFILDVQSRRVRKIEVSSKKVITVAGRLHSGDEYTGEGGPAVAATLASPNCIALAQNGDLYIADDAAIRRVDSSGTITTIAGGGAGVPIDGEQISAARYGLIAGIVVDGSGNLLIADSLNHLVLRLDFASGVVTYIAGIAGIQASTGDGYAARECALDNPGRMAMDSDGRLYIASHFFSNIRTVRVIKLAPPVAPQG